MYNSREIAERIKFQAKLQNLSLRTLLSNCGLGPNTVGKISKGTDILSLNLAKIADELDVSVDYLLGRTDDPHFGQQKNELIALINQLTPAEQDKVIAFYRLLKDEQTPPQQQ